MRNHRPFQFAWLYVWLMIGVAACTTAVPGPLPTETVPLTPVPFSETAPIPTGTAAVPTPTELLSGATATRDVSTPTVLASPTGSSTNESPNAPIVPALIRSVRPQVEGPRVVVESWSPDGRWLAYRIFAGAAPEQPASLHFINPGTSENCPYPGTASSSLTVPTVIWGEEGAVIVREDGGFQAGEPCQEFRPVAFEMPVVGFSPTGVYAAETRVTSSGDGVLQARTTIRSVGSGAELEGFDWSVEQRLGDLGLGGQWLTEDRFLLYETRERGPVLIQAGSEPVAVAAELFGTSHEPAPGVILAARGAVVMGTDDYHIVLYGVGIEADFPVIRLYHSESGLIDDLPFRHVWFPVFSPDGRWLLLRGEQEDVYLAPVETAGVNPQKGAPLQVVDNAAGPMVWSPGADRLAYTAGELVQVLNTGSGQVTSRWQAEGFQLHPAAWSPDGAYVAATGTSLAGGQDGLFLISINQP